ncbi:hypothetical protein ABHB47_03420 [Flavonifractor plautii]|uniref:hypothetical protein n=1 Tax=Flavonifractor plautii TaxID=292800 RepID=UPI00232BC308|nr:hypothetical protein [Flavonifractor plautii]MDB7895698.1 hypothetical protein [Flavonifractor plautii]
MNIQQAITIVKKAFPNGIIHKKAEYGNLYLFMVFSPDDSEGSMDAIYSINKETGEFRDFPYMDEKHFAAVMRLFSESPILGA